MVASKDHGQPLLAPRCTCGQLQILPQVYLDLMFKKPLADEAEAESSTPPAAGTLPRRPAIMAKQSVGQATAEGFGQEQ